MKRGSFSRKLLNRFDNCEPVASARDIILLLLESIFLFVFYLLF